MDPDLSVIIPAYNEAGRIAPTLERINDYLRGSSFTSEILVVLDGPTDNTHGVLRKISEKVPNLRIVAKIAAKATQRRDVEGIRAIAAFLRCRQFY
jgi:dolichyl-phosphate beta-glucosyltransferase